MYYYYMDYSFSKNSATSLGLLLWSVIIFDVTHLVINMIEASA